VPDDEGLFCLFCGRTEPEHKAPGPGGAGGKDAFFSGARPDEFADTAVEGDLEEEDDWDAIQDELKRLTKRCRQEAEAREKAELLLSEMKGAFEKLREDVGHIRSWGSASDGQLGHRGQRPALVELHGILRQMSCGGAHTAALTDDGQMYVWGRGNEGQLGLGDFRPRAVPALLKALGDKAAGTTVLQVACGGAHTLVLVDNGDVYGFGSNDDMQLGMGPGVGKKVNRPELIADLSGKGILRVAAGKNFSMALSESGDVYTWGAGSALQLGHGGKASEEYPRMVEALRDVRKLAAGSSAEHAATLVGEAAGGADDDDEQEDDVKAAEEQLEKARNRREDAMRAMTADVEALELQVNKLDAKLASSDGDESMVAQMHALKENIKAEVAELEIVVSGKQQLEESMTLLNKHKTNQFRTNMLMKWSRPGAAAEGGGGGGGGDGMAGGGMAGGGFTPRTLGKKQEELRTMQGEKKTLVSELKDCDDQLEQIEMEKARLAEGGDEDPDIAEALEELREQLNESKREKLQELQSIEQAERRLGTELGVAVATADTGGGGASGGGGGGDGGGGGGGGGGGMDAGTQMFVKAASTLWKRLETSSIEKINVGQQEALGVKDLIKLSNEQIDTVTVEVRRAASKKRDGESEVMNLLLELMLDNSACRKRLNDYTEGLLVQTAHKMESFKAAYEASKAGKKDKSFFTPRKF